MPGDPVEEAAALLRAGSVVAVKGLGGYHLAAAAEHEDAVAALRARKHREDKPFAVMVPDLAAARRARAGVAGGGSGARERPAAHRPRAPAPGRPGGAPPSRQGIARSG